MNSIREEILEIPARAQECCERNRGLQLPLNVPYLGMGSSYFGPLTLYYCQKSINPQMASEFHYYLPDEERPAAVLISLSGESSDTVWNIDKFKGVVAITDNEESTLATHEKTKQLVRLYAGTENYSSTKSYINTLLVLYIGLGIDPQIGVKALEERLTSIDEEAQECAEGIFEYIQSRQIKGLYIIGSGPNLGTAYEGGVTLSEATKLAWLGMSVAQYDHGPKETANDSVVVILNSHGRDARRIGLLKEIVQTKSNCLMVELEERELPEALSPLTLILKLNFIMDYLVDYMSPGDAFQLGGKVTIIPDEGK